VTLRARWVDAKSSLGDAKSSLGDAESSLGAHLRHAFLRSDRICRRRSHGQCCRLRVNLRRSSRPRRTLRLCFGLGRLHHRLDPFHSFRGAANTQGSFSAKDPMKFGIS
jgi:hypothetical protein